MIRENDIQFDNDYEHDDYIIIKALYKQRTEARVSKRIGRQAEYDPVREAHYRMKLQLVDSLYKEVIIGHHELKRQLLYLIHPRHMNHEVMGLLNRFAPTDRERFLV